MTEHIIFCRHFKIGVFLSVLMAVLVFSYEFAGASWSHREIDADKRTINGSFPGLLNWTPGANLGVNAAAVGVDENASVIWNNLADKRPNAAIVVNKSSRGFNRSFFAKISSLIGFFMKGQRESYPSLHYKIIGEEMIGNNTDLGDFRYMRFETRVGGVSKNCALFHQDRYQGKKLIDAWYCAADGRALGNDTILDVIASIDIDWSPGKNTPKREKQTSTKNDTKSDASVRDRLKELKKLESEGLITEEEAAAKRAKLLEDL